MQLSALVIGFGSIGKRHAKILHSMDGVSKLSVLSSQKGLPYETITKFEQIEDLDPDYIVVSSPTNCHYQHLEFLENTQRNKKILVEKPLFTEDNDLHLSKNEIFVAYNLRFHPHLEAVKDALSGREIWSVHARCGSYLPDWRPDRDYKETSSANKSMGGGVLLDLSHEFDYLHWLLGPIRVLDAISGKVSNLEIDTDDFLLFNGKTESGAYVNVSLDYFSKEANRSLEINGKDICININLISNTLTMNIDGKEIFVERKDLDQNYTYEAQHYAILNGNYSNLCLYKQGMQTMKLIEKIRSIQDK